MIQVVARAADILFILARHPDGLTLAELAQMLSMPRSTVQRIVKTLEHANLLIAASAQGGVRLGPALAFLATSMRPFDIVRMIHPYLVRLASETGETVELSLLAHGHAVVVAQIHGVHTLRVLSNIGTSLPLHATAIGKAMLAALPPEELKTLRNQITLDPLTPNTKTTWKELEREFAAIRKNRIAYDQEENVMGICSLGMAIQDQQGEMASVSILLPALRFESSREQLAQALLNCGEAFQRRH